MGVLVSPFTGTTRFAHNLTIGIKNNVDTLDKSNEIRTDRFRYPMHMCYNEPLQFYDQNLSEIYEYFYNNKLNLDQKVIFNTLVTSGDGKFYKDKVNVILTDQEVILLYRKLLLFHFEYKNINTFKKTETDSTITLETEMKDLTKHTIILVDKDMMEIIFKLIVKYITIHDKKN